MNKQPYLLLFALLFFFSCTKIENDSAIFNKSLQVNSENSKKFDISQKSVEKYIQITNAKKPDLIVKEIVPIVKGADTLLYIVNFANNRGWKIVSGDKRTNPELSSSKIGAFNTHDANPGVTLWLNEMCNNIYTLKCSSNCDTTSSYYKLWTNIESVGKFKKANSPALTKGGGEEEEGYWTLVYVESEELTPINMVDHLLTTSWTQHSPWNSCVPFIRSDFSGGNCAAGCGPIAAAQVAYYLHYKIGVPKYAYINGSCTGYIEDPNHFNINTPDSTVWDNMAVSGIIPSPGTEKASILIGKIGSLTISSWGENNSSMESPEQLSNYFTQNGINFNYCNYTYSIVRLNLDIQLPVIVSAVYDYDQFLWWQYRVKGHIWVIDGYKDSRTSYTYYYQWFAKDDPLPEVDLTDTEHIRIEQATITNNKLLMNWGYGSIYNQGEYLYDGDWIIDNKNYQYYRKILCNFSKL